MKLTYIKQGSEPVGDAGDQYTGLDRFGRVVDQRWIKNNGAALERVDYGYSRAGNRQWRWNRVATNGQDEYYNYDGLYQVKELQRGTLNSTKTAISGTPTWEEDFTYDPIGNWNAYLTKVSGVTDLDQERTHNEANETAEIDGSADTVGHDGAGNMVVVPQINDWEATVDLKWDAWNRLVEVTEGDTTIAQYRYDGLTRRATKTTNATRHYYYSDQWQIMEERVDEESTADRQFVWGRRYMDDLVLRDRDTDGNGSLNERLYVLHDYFHPTAVAAPNGTVLERYGYDAFGLSRVMTAAFNPRASSNYDWETRYGAYRWDAETGFYQVRFRYLHPILGRWLSRDIIAEQGGKNTFAYCNNLPISLVDYFGLAPLPGSCSVADCKKAANEVIKKGSYNSDTIISNLAGKLKNKGCKLEILCLKDSDCGPLNKDNPANSDTYILRRSPKEGGDITVYNIRICPSALSSGLSLDRALRHELAHAVQYCSGLQADTCENALTHELYAYSKDGDCEQWKSVSQPAYFGCLKDRAKGSVGLSTVCDGKNPDVIMTDAFVTEAIKDRI